MALPVFGFYIDGDFHAKFVFRIAPVAAGKGDGLSGQARHPDPDQVTIAHYSVCWIELDPSRAGHVDLAPCVRRATAQPNRTIANGNVDVAGNKTCGETQRPRSLHHEESEIPACSLLTIDRLARGLSPRRRPPLVRKALRHRLVQGHQELPGRPSHADRHELGQPFVDRSVLGIVTVHVRREIWKLPFCV